MPPLKRPLVVFLDLLPGICLAVKPCMSKFVVSLFEIHVSLRKIKSYSDKLFKKSQSAIFRLSPFTFQKTVFREYSS